eukprot:TRINITY_DN7632_c0_g1_i1.p1 TRINITY_DN7632_c0_g1~~TRINITY_DN7632_c0_g1_i1.p1  ORF type:complete len:794 (-),score=146.07 TRINITY_DN7632_c0_g1_i1:75-2456(-)
MSSGYLKRSRSDSSSEETQIKRSRTEKDTHQVSKKRTPEDHIENSEPPKKPKMKASLSGSARVNSNQPKKLNISLKARPTLPNNYEKDTWTTLRLAVNAVQTQRAINTTREELYKAVENLVDHNLSENLYKNLFNECEIHVGEQLTKLIEESSSSSLHGFLEIVNRYWNIHCQEMLFIRSIFLYLDRKYALPSPTIKSIWDFGLDLFSTHVVSIETIQAKLRTGLLKEIENDRKGEDVDKILLKNLLRMLRSLDLYTSQFEGYFLEETKVYYRQESKRYIDESQISDIIVYLERKFDEENQRVLQYLDLSTRKPLIANLETVLLATHMQEILDKGFDELLEKNAVTELKKLFTLFMRVDGLPKIKNSWNAYIKKCGTALVNDEQNDKTMIEGLLKFKEKLDNILKVAFSNAEELSYSQKEAFEYFINQRQNVPAEMLAKFLDGKLRGGKSNRDMNEIELDSLLDNVLQIFRFINGKDVFEAFYKKDLARRLLLNKFASMDAEKSMIQKLKTECGSSFTMQLEGMFKDISASGEVTEAFRDSNFYRDWEPKTVDAKVFVLTTGFWPPYPSQKCNLPNELSSFVRVFENFYGERHNGRRLLWQHSLGQCSVVGMFPKGKKDLEVSLYQAVVLNLFNQADKLTFGDIKSATDIEEGELKRVIASLACGTVRVLTRTSADANNKNIENADEFTFRDDFQHKQRRLKINAVQAKETVTDNKKVKENVFKDRVYQVDAAIVRIMKTRKELTYQQLVSELLAQLRFPVNPADLKKRIESLLEREFLERDSDDPNIYRYLA